MSDRIWARIAASGDVLGSGGEVPAMTATGSQIGASVGWLRMTNARRQGAICSWSGDDRPWSTVAHEDPSFLEVFRL
jgi:hypothetical protein